VQRSACRLVGANKCQKSVKTKENLQVGARAIVSNCGGSKEH
jgi:hypothetical protein